MEDSLFPELAFADGKELDLSAYLFDDQDQLAFQHVAKSVHSQSSMPDSPPSFVASQDQLQHTEDSDIWYEQFDLDKIINDVSQTEKDIPHDQEQFKIASCITENPISSNKLKFNDCLSNLALEQLMDTGFHFYNETKPSLNYQESSVACPPNYRESPVASLLNYQESPVASLLNYQESPVASPLNYQESPVASPLNYQESPVASPLNYQESPVASPLNYQESPVASPLTTLWGIQESVGVNQINFQNCHVASTPTYPESPVYHEASTTLEFPNPQEILGIQSSVKTESDFTFYGINAENNVAASTSVISVPLSDAVVDLKPNLKKINITSIELIVNSALKSQHSQKFIPVTPLGQQHPQKIVINVKRVSLPSKSQTVIEQPKPTLKDILSSGDGDDLVFQMVNQSAVQGNKETVNGTASNLEFDDILFNNFSHETTVVVDDDDSSSEGFQSPSSNIDLNSYDQFEMTELSGAVKSRTMSRRSPYSLQEKRERKKEQNKRAALKYRQKKKEEEESTMSLIEKEERRHELLTKKKETLCMEVRFMKNLLREAILKKRIG